MNRSWRKRRLTRAWLSDTPPDARPSAEDFCYLREPGEEERNPFDRRLAFFRWQWLLLRNRLFTGGGSRENLDLKKGQQGSVAVELTPLRRGVIRFNDLRLQLPDPLGLVPTLPESERAAGDSHRFATPLSAASHRTAGWRGV